MQVKDETVHFIKFWLKYHLLLLLTHKLLKKEEIEKITLIFQIIQIKDKNQLCKVSEVNFVKKEMSKYF